MRKLSFRLLLIALLVAALLHINNNPGQNYGTQIRSKITGKQIDVTEVVAKFPEKLDEWNAVLYEWTEKILEEFGFSSSK